jgi:hypothetical protein
LAEHPLTAEPQDQPIILGVVFADRGARLHRADNVAVVAHRQRRDMPSLGKRRRDLLAVAKMKIQDLRYISSGIA